MMRKFADAVIVSPSVTSSGWKAIRTAATHKKQAKILPMNLVDRATMILGKPFDPKDYLLSHVTIVSSVDTYEPEGVGFTPGVNRPFKDFRITKETEKYINNNNDAFERKALLKAYPTFIGGHNYCFTPETPIVMADGTVKPIREVCVGDIVLTQGGSPGEVTELFERDFRGLLCEVEVGGQLVRSTPNHPFSYIQDGKPSMAPIEDLEIGTLLVAPNMGTLPITQKAARPYSGKVYTFEVSDDHTYVVGPGIAVHNCEHVQLEELSKGRILDAVARDLGDTVYVDLLLATDRRHVELCKAIESKDLYTLSMGCTISFSICTQCGNKAVDESEMCDHIKYKKGSTFTDESGNQCKVAELCGHYTEEPNAGIQFVEASWVEVPAFAGAVLNETLSVVAGTAKTPGTLGGAKVKGKKKMAADWSDVDFSAAEGGGEDSAEEGDGAEPKDPFADLEDEATQLFIDKIRKNLKEVLDAKKEPPKTQTSTTQSNDSIVKSAGRVKQAAMRMALQTLVRTASSDAEAIDRVAAFTQAHGIKVPLSLYRGLVMLGGDYSPENLRKLAQVEQLSESSRQLAEKIASLLLQRSSINQRGVK
jgi:hypothetical protein